MRDTDQRLLEEAYDASIESEKWDIWLSQLEGRYKGPDGTIDVDGSVILAGRNLKKIPFKFGIVNGNFDCSNNPFLENLNGSPQKVGRIFDCTHSRLKTLEGAPLEVGDFNCSVNLLSDLKYAPSVVKKDFFCYCNPLLKTLEGAPESIGWDFDCHGCIELESLRWAPQCDKGEFDCAGCGKLESLKFLPRAKKYDVRPFTQADIDKELRRRDLEKEMSSQAKEDWGDTWDNL